MARILPADILPAPKVAYGVKRLRRAYAGSAIRVFKPSNSTYLDIGFVDDDLDYTALDNFLTGNEIGRVVTVYDQMGTGLNLEQGDIAKAPKIHHQIKIGGARSLLFEGHNNSGAIFGMRAASVASLGLTAGNVGVVMVTQAASSIHRNQAATPDRSIGTLVSLEGSADSLFHVYSNGGEVPGSPSTMGRGNYTITDHAALLLSPQDTCVELGPAVVFATSGSFGTRLYQNEVVWSASEASAIVTPITNIYVGQRGNSVAGGSSECGGFQCNALMIYNQGIAGRKRAAISGAFYSLFNIYYKRSSPHVPCVAMVADSIGAEYNAPGTYGAMHWLQDALPKVRLLNFAVPGQQTTSQTGSPAYSFSQGQFPLMILPSLAYSKRKTVFIILGPGNDFERFPTLWYDTLMTPFHAGQVVTGGTSGAHGTIIAVTPVAPTSGVLLLNWHDSYVAGFIENESLTDPLGGSALVNKHPTSGQPLDPDGPVPPGIVLAVHQQQIDDARAVGVTQLGALWCTILPRAALSKFKIEDYNTALRAVAAGAHNFTVVDAAADSQLSVPYPGPIYADAGHMSMSGNIRFKEVLLPFIEAAIA
jgi:hypothetical protein